MPPRSNVSSPSRSSCFDRKIVTYLNDDEVDALLGACDLGTWAGRRDQALLDLAVEAGARISELAAAQVLGRDPRQGRQPPRDGEGPQGASGPPRQGSRQGATSLAA